MMTTSRPILCNAETQKVPAESSEQAEQIEQLESDLEGGQLSMAKLPDWIQDCKDRGVELYARGLENGKPFDAEEAVLWRTHGMDLIEKISQQAEQIRQLERWAAFLRCCALSGEVPMYDTRDEFEAAAAGKEGGA